VNISEADYLPVVVIALVVLAIVDAVWLHFRRSSAPASQIKERLWIEAARTRAGQSPASF
jgi:hypothetical protein